jgi:hypothetical protein
MPQTAKMTRERCGRDPLPAEQQNLRRRIGEPIQIDLTGSIFRLGFALRQKVEPALRDPEPGGFIGIAGSALKLFLRLPGIFPVFVVLRHGMTPSHAQMEPVNPTAQIADKIRFAISRPPIVASPRYLSNA